MGVSFTTISKKEVDEDLKNKIVLLSEDLSKGYGWQSEPLVFLINDEAKLLIDIKFNEFFEDLHKALEIVGQISKDLAINFDVNIAGEEGSIEEGILSENLQKIKSELLEAARLIEGFEM